MVGSGVILVALHNNDAYYLFGKECSMERDKNCDWGDFGGARKDGEDLLDTTTREGAEELNGFFGSKADFEKYILKNKIDEVVYDQRYTYLVMADYDEKLPYYFKNNHKFISEYLKGHVNNPTNGLFEKSEVRWFSVNDLKREKNIFRSYFRNIINIIIYNHSKTLSKLRKMCCKRGKKTRASRVKFSTSDLMKCDRLKKYKKTRKVTKKTAKRRK